MTSTRETCTNILRVSAATCLVAGLSLSFNLHAEEEAEIISIQFSQTIPGGGTVTGLIVGQDLDGDGRLYSMAPGLADFLGVPVGDEVIYASVRIDGLLGQPVVNVFDRSVAGIDDMSNFFWGFSIGVDGDSFGQHPMDGMSFAPLAPSTSYTAGALMAPAVSGSVISESIGNCQDPDVDACSAITTLNPVDPFPSFELLFHATSPEPIMTTRLLRYTFEQTGFDGGATISGTISGEDLDGDGWLYSVGPAWVDFFGMPPGDEIRYATVTIRGVTPEAIVNTVDLVTTDINDFDNFFFGARIKVSGDQIGKHPDETLSISPWSPSTSYVVGETFGMGFFPIFTDQGLMNCGNDEGEPCAALLSLIPNPDSPTGTGADLKAVQYSDQPVSRTAAPFIVDSNFSGHWDNKAAQGEGLILQVIANGHVLVYWVTYDGSGNQRWVYGFGTRQGDRIIVQDLYVTSGGMMAGTTPVDFDHDPIGNLTIQFFDCDNAEVAFAVDGVSGTMEIGRLTGLSSLECVR